MSCDTPARLTHYFDRCLLNHIKVKSSQVSNFGLTFGVFDFAIRLLLLGPSEADRGRDVRKRANRGVVLRKMSAAALRSS